MLTQSEAQLVAVLLEELADHRDRGVRAAAGTRPPRNGTGRPVSMICGPAGAMPPLRTAMPPPWGPTGTRRTKSGRCGRVIGSL
jgi:hypothetical protein